MVPSRLATEYFLAHVVDLARARGAGALAALGSRAAVAARTNDARRGGERIADPGGVQHVGDRAERVAGRLRGACLAAAVPALAKDAVDPALAAQAFGGERRREIPPD